MRSNTNQRDAHSAFTDENGVFEDENFSLNAKGYIEFNKDLVIDSRYRLQQEIILDEDLGTTAKGRYGSVFRVVDLQDGQIKALKINRIPPEEEDAKRQAAKDHLKQQQAAAAAVAVHSGPSNDTPAKPTALGVGGGGAAPNGTGSGVTNHRRRRVKSVQERYRSSCKREIGVLKRVTRQNQSELIPCLVLLDYGEYLGHTYMVFPVYDLPLQQHLVNCLRHQEEVQKAGGGRSNPPNTAPNNALIHPEDLWAFEEQLISALSYIHNVCHVMHLDFKPKNIMINRYAYDVEKYAKNLHLVKLRKNAITLIDFSVSAKAPKKANLDQVRYTGNFGTRRYRPPEMIYGGKWNRSVDTYGTAMIILECIKLFPIIDTTYYKKKKILVFKKKMKRAHQLTAANKQHHDRLHAQQDRLNGLRKADEVAAKLSPPQPSPTPSKPRLNGSYKQLDISEVLYLIVQQIGFPQKAYWLGLGPKERALFPQHPLIENIRRKGKRSKLFDNDGAFELRSAAPATERKEDDLANGHGDAPRDGDGDSDDSSEEEEEDPMGWGTFSDKLKAHRGTSWNLFKHYGSNLIETMRLRKMEESLRRMVVWDPTRRITPEQCLREYFPKNDHRTDHLLHDDMDDDF